MPKAKTKLQNTSSTKLVDALENAKQIKGLVGYVLFSDGASDEDGDIAVKVRVVKLDTSGCGLQVVVCPVSGEGEFKITPCRWFDDKSQIKTKREYAEKLEAANNELQRFNDMHYLKNRRQELDAIANKLTKKDLEDFKADLQENKLSVDKLTIEQLQNYLRTIVSQIYGVKREDLKNHYRY